MHRSNLHVCKDLHVEKLHLVPPAGNTDEVEPPPLEDKKEWPRDIHGNKRTCLGVIVKDPKSPNGQRLIKVRREVLLTAGAIGSPHILQCSGVGEGKLLQNNGVEVKVVLPGVGENLQVLSLGVVVSQYGKHICTFLAFFLLSFSF
jgi:choline dehydrogenase-like flavoprotein